MKIKHCAAALLALALLLFLPWAVMAAPVGKITNLQGNVDITVKGKAARVASPGDPVNIGDFIRTKSKSKAEITFNEGNVLRLAENTRVGITEYMSGKKKNSSILNLFRGRIQNIVKTIGAITGGRYEVHTPTAVCGVRGTIFYVGQSYGATNVAVLEGTVAATTYAPPATPGTPPRQVAVVLTQNQQITLTQNLVSSDMAQQQVRTLSPQQIQELNNSTEISGSSGDSGGTGGSGSTGDTAPPPPPVTSSYTPPVVVPPPVQPVQSVQTIETTDLNLNITAGDISFTHKIDTGGTITGTTSDGGTTFPVTVSGVMEGTADDPAGGLIKGTITTGTTVVSAVSGYMMGLPNLTHTTAKALIYSIYVNNDGQAGYLFSPYPMNATFSASSFSGTGTAVKYAPESASAYTPSTLTLGIISNLSLPAFGNVSLNANGHLALSCSNATCESEARGINVTGGKIGVWGAYSTSTGVGATYSNLSTLTSSSNNKYIYYSSLKDILFSDNLSFAVDTAAKEVSIKGDFLYMSTLYKGSLTMNHLGYYDDSSLYTSISSGTLKLQPMAFANELSSSLTDVNGIMGSTTGLWTNTNIPVTMAGTYSGLSTYNVISGNWQSNNYVLGSGTLTNDGGGAYKGYLNTQLLQSSINTIGTDVLALYTDTSGNIGILRGYIPGSVYAEQTGFKADGTLNRIEMATSTSVQAGTFVSSGTTSSSFTLSANVSNILSGGPSLNLNTLNSNWLDITGYNWGIGKIYSAGTYTGDPQGNAVFSYERSGSAGTESFVYSQLEASWTAASGGYFLGNVAGASVDWTSASTSVFGGTVKGIFNAATASTWYATALATRIETENFIDLAATAAGRTKLDSLNIPSVLVGSVNMSTAGGDPNWTSLNINNMGFYARTDGGKPQIWASKSITGTAAAAPLNTTSTLTGSTGGTVFSANFTVKNWSANKWAATITGGTINPALNTATKFQGGAAGAYSGLGITAGTASGTVH